ncbi:MAG TPA: hypothetical protein VKR57_02135 [Terriglobales bacterium]|nr:hypothetical protein [Terriglobales bacterium]
MNCVRSQCSTHWAVRIVLVLGWLCIALPGHSIANPLPQNAMSTPQFDGPAELPRAYVRSSLADTPAPGRTLLVKEGEDLQKVLDAASCGDIIALQAGATFHGLFKIPAKPCDDSHWIIIRTSASERDLPPEGTRMRPCYAGVDALPGRPPFDCASTKNVLAKLSYAASSGSGPIVLTDGANHYRFLGLEITRESPGATIYNLVLQEDGGDASHLIFDRVWIHGTPQDETTRGILLGGSSQVAVVDSFFSDFHCTAGTGACTDAQAIAGGMGSRPMGPYKIVNNFLEAAAESVLFGGGSATQVPTDIEIRHNYLFKPVIWRPGDPHFVGAANGRPFIVKNLFELKNAQRVLFEGNILENAWGGFSQTGFAILLTPKNQGHNTCPLCTVTDVTIRDCKISHVGSGFQIANSRDDSGAAASAGERYSIHDVIIDDIGKPSSQGIGTLAQISMDTPTLRSVALNHITAFPPKSLFLVGGPPGRAMRDFSFTNSIVTAGEYQFTATGGGPQLACSSEPGGNAPGDVLKNCFNSYRFDHNAIIGGWGNWPRGNNFPKTLRDVGFTNYSDGSGSDYHLSKQSRFRNGGTDGKDLGADVDAVTRATAGAQ